MITNLRYADDIILLATSEAELQELVDRLDRVSPVAAKLVNGPWCKKNRWAPCSHGKNFTKQK